MRSSEGRSARSRGLLRVADKASGVTYAGFRAQVAARTADEMVTVWRQQMVLGPAPEFRVTADRGLSMPAVMAPVACRLTRLSIA
jgi:hypothetical protein